VDSIAGFDARRHEGAARGAVDRHGLKEGDTVTAVVKATSVMIGK